MTDRSKRRAEARRLAKIAKKQSQSNVAAQPTPTQPIESTISAAQLSANQANAKLSTGPTSQEGLDISSRNNFRHGLTQNEGDLILLESESAEAYNRSLAEFKKEWLPTGATENDLVERLTNHQWLRRRSLKLQNEFLAPNGLITDEKKFALYRRYETQHERAFNKALSDLIRLRSLHIREQNGFESQRRKDEIHTYKIKALQDRESRNSMALIEAEAKVTLAQYKLSLAGLPTGSPTDANSDELSLEATN